MCPPPANGSAVCEDGPGGACNLLRVAERPPNAALTCRHTSNVLHWGLASKADLQLRKCAWNHVVIWRDVHITTAWCTLALVLGHGCSCCNQTQCPDSVARSKPPNIKLCCRTAAGASACATDLKFYICRYVEQRPDASLELAHAIGPWAHCNSVHPLAKGHNHDGLHWRSRLLRGGRQRALPIRQLMRAEATPAFLPTTACMVALNEVSATWKQTAWRMQPAPDELRQPSAQRLTVCLPAAAAIAPGNGCAPAWDMRRATPSCRCCPGR